MLSRFFLLSFFSMFLDFSRAWDDIIIPPPSSKKTGPTSVIFFGQGFPFPPPHTHSSY
jgi:hypothetical protein